ncbi:hypothetical protein TW95_gp0335 [Pandoravirus inopinatum]|uniref:Uncharacterized protein n=1 Tax=Pandoravirus inopinatum TaxID=1605721 RepID=A0A0B5J0S4_9VIRU|nr:hypothetical protein TW95_gp0335 [Pandoravirus inopinatum]AJF97069.1 hypothetical protein [Pandoravirus inopinatum]
MGAAHPVPSTLHDSAGHGADDDDSDDMEISRLTGFGLEATRAFLMSCVDPVAGAVDADALAKAEYQHNRRATLRALQSVPGGAILYVGTLCRSDDGLLYAQCASVRRTGNDRFEFAVAPTSRRGTTPSCWTEEDIARGIGALTLSHVLYVTSRPAREHKAVTDAVRALMDNTWLATAARALSSHPASEPWTADCILCMGPLLAFLADTCARRIGDATGDNRPRAPSPACPTRADAAVRAILDTEGRHEMGGSVDASWHRATYLEQDLRGMLAWIKALEQTDAVAEHLIGERYRRASSPATTAG